MENDVNLIWVGLNKFLFGMGGIPIVLISISAIYFFSNRGVSHGVRFLSSAHGVVAAILYAAVLFLWKSGGSNESFLYLFWALLLFPLALIIYSFWGFKGHKAFHILHVASIGCLILVWFIGSMAVTDDWL
jgi:hypothetical protein